MVSSYAEYPAVLWRHSITTQNMATGHSRGIAIQTTQYNYNIAVSQPVCATVLLCYIIVLE